MITPVQQRVFDFVKAYISEHGYSPSLTEIAVGIGISAKSISLISRSVHGLVAAGRFKFHKKGYRNIEIVDSVPRSDVTQLFIVGRLSLGQPIEAVSPAESLTVEWMLTPGDHIVYEMKDDTMAQQGILAGDYLICKKTHEATEGQHVVALIEKQETVFSQVSHKIPGRITLVPANTSQKPKAYLPHSIEIQGVFLALLRLVR